VYVNTWQDVVLACQLRNSLDSRTCIVYLSEEIPKTVVTKVPKFDSIDPELAARCQNSLSDRVRLIDRRRQHQNANFVGSSCLGRRRQLVRGLVRFDMSTGSHRQVETIESDSAKVFAHLWDRPRLKALRERAKAIGRVACFGRKSFRPG
jgi:hypothetical protein